MELAREAVAVFHRDSIGANRLRLNDKVQRILIVEDDAKTAQNLVTGFSAEGFSVRAALDGEDALKSIAATTFDVIVLDWMLPGQDGLQVLRSLRDRAADALQIFTDR